MTEYFLIHSQQRHGTHFLRTLLDSHPHIRVYDELIKELSVDVPVRMRLPARYTFMKLRKGAPHAWCEAYRAFKHDAPIVGCCVHSGQIFSYGKHAQRRGEIRGALAQFDWKVIDLVRKNMLEAFISERAAWLTRSWRWEDTLGNPTTAKIKFKPGDWQKYAVYKQRARRKAREAFAHCPTHLVWYEDLCERTQEETAKIQAFLGMPVRELRASTYKQERRPLADRVRNWSTVEQTLKDTYWEGCLHGEPPEWPREDEN